MQDGKTNKIKQSIVVLHNELTVSTNLPESCPSSFHRMSLRGEQLICKAKIKTLLFTKQNKKIFAIMYMLLLLVSKIVWPEPKYLRLIHFPRQLDPTDNVAPLIRAS